MRKILRLFCVLFAVSMLVFNCSSKPNLDKELELELEDTIRYSLVDNFLDGKSYCESVSYTADTMSYITMSIPGDSEDSHFIYGVYVTFYDSIYYVRRNSAPCGNDCFFNEMGKYYLLATDTLVMRPDSTTFSYECGMKNLVYGRGLGNKYYLQTDSISNSIRLIPCSY